MTAKTARAVAYIRTAALLRGGEHWTGQQAQRIRRFCSQQGYTLIGVFVDYGVAGDGRRVGLRDALSVLREGQADVLIVANVSRLERSLAALARLVDSDLGDGTRGLIALDEGLDPRTDNGRFVLSLLRVIQRWDAKGMRRAS